MDWCEYHQQNHIREHTASTYSNHRCRCVDCRGAWNVKHQEWSKRRLARGVPARVHGTVNGYTNYMCRCERCSRANRESRAEYRARKRATESF